MLKFDFFSYTEKFINKNEFADLLDKKNLILDKFHSSDMIGWTKRPSKDTIEKILETSKKIKATSNCLVVIGIGGSFLGSFAYNNIFKDYFNDRNFEVIYAGTSLSSKYLQDLITYLEDKDFTINVISKSGTTLETTITYDILKSLLERKYSIEEAESRIIITTSKDSPLTKNKKASQIFEIPNDIGGRYSFITPAHLLPLSLNYDIYRILDNYFEGLKLVDEAYTYACIRNILFNKGYFVENFSIYEESLSFFAEWLKQLFAESEGKANKGILPISTIGTRDLHSLGQFIQEGHKIIFETFFKVENSSSLYCNEKDLYSINNIVETSVITAHNKGSIPCNVIELDYLSEENISKLIAFFQLSAVFSAYLFDVNPFDQPGVEVYKNEIKVNL